MNFDPQSIKLFSFDFDGTLMHSNHIKQQAFIDVVAKETSENQAAANTIKSIVSQNTHLDRYGIFLKLAQSYTDLNPEKLAASYGEQCEQLILKTKQIRGTTQLLQIIKNHGKHAVINTATPQTAMQSIISQMNIADNLDAVYGAPTNKATNLEIAMERFNATPAQTLMVGDRENDRIAAEQINCHFIGIKSDISDYIKTPNNLYEDLEPLVKLLKNEELPNV